MTRTVHIGMDDIDDPTGGCTTHFASLLVEKLSRLQIKWIDYPNLIRLNPNVPYRTRGNGAVALRFETNNVEVDDLLSQVMEPVWKYIRGEYPNTNPGVVLVIDEIPKDIRDLSQRALWRVLPRTLGGRLVMKHDLLSISFGNGRGLIGALAAIGNRLEQDYTYEYIAYRSIEQSHGPRGVDPDSVRRMDAEFGDRLFSSVEHESGRILIEPHGPDPVIYGIRGERPEYVVEAASVVKSVQSVERWMVFRSNQGTSAHMTRKTTISNLRPYMAITVEGMVSSNPRSIEGGHVVFPLTDATGTIDCAAYEPSGSFRNIVTLLKPNDRIIVSAGVRPRSRRHGMTLNVEGLEVLDVAEVLQFTNPSCPKCSKRMKSAGKEKGFKCVNCGFKDPKGEKAAEKVPRELKVGFYLPPASAQRHLTRPVERLNRRNHGASIHMIDRWHAP